MTNAVVLAAGFGSRMGSYTKNIPKPLLPINGRPLLDYTIRQLASCGIKKLFLNTHYHANQIDDFVGSGEKFGLEISTVFEKEPTGTSGGVRNFKNELQKNECFLVIYGDIFTDLDYQALLVQHNKQPGLATICVHRRPKSNSIACFDNNKKVTEFIERPETKELARFPDGVWVNSAIYCFSPEIFNYCASDGFEDFPKDVFPSLVRDHELYAYPINCHRVAIDNEQKYLEAQETCKNFKFSFIERDLQKN